MVLPITGPILSTVTGSFQITDREIYRQKPPYNLELPYRSLTRYGKNSWYVRDAFGQVSNGEEAQPDFGPGWFSDEARYESNAYNQAYEKFKDKTRDSSSWLENLAQINKTRSAFVGRLVQLSNFMVALEKGQFRKAAKILKTPVPKNVSRRRAVAENFLEWEYGVKPVLSDLESLMKALTRDLGTQRVKARARDFLSTYDSDVTYSEDGFRGFTVSDARLEVSVEIRADVRIDNPNVFLANQLGLFDFALPWKLLPFSFIVDWLINVEQFINSSSDWYGLSLEKASRSFFRTGSNLVQSRTASLYGVAYADSTLTRRYSELKRYVGISGPTIVLKPFRGFSLSRGAQSIALVLAVFSK